MSTATLPTKTLGQLAERINEAYLGCIGMVRNSLELARDCGESASPASCSSSSVRRVFSLAWIVADVAPSAS